MADRTKIDWCDSSWNPVTGCNHGCEYCYARGIAKRFSCEGQTLDAPAELQRVWLNDGGTDLRQKGCHVLRYPVRLLDSGRICPYPFAFAPTLHRYKLNEPQKWKRPRTIFVCSMADLFGDWVPDSWIEDVFAACENAPQHRYLFLTKNPARYMQLVNKGIVMPNTIEWWYGYTVDGLRELPDCRPIGWHAFVSVEPLLRALDAKMLDDIAKASWIIIGAETGNRKGKVIPEKAWVEEITRKAAESETPVFMKESLREIMGKDFRQEFPWEVMV